MDRFAICPELSQRIGEICIRMSAEMDLSAAMELMPTVLCIRPVSSTGRFPENA